jgi:hypothetical protein
MRIRKRIASWLDPMPERLHAEQVELLVKAARRCAHDLAHAGSDVYYTPYDKKARAKFWAERAQMWLDMFYPGNDGKNYRHKLYSDIENLEQQVEELKRVCLEHGIDPLKDKRVNQLDHIINDIPF